MNRYLAAVTLSSAALLGIGCRSTPDVERVTLQCDTPGNAGGFFGFYSFTAGKLTPPFKNPRQIDLVYYFDRDDCSKGAILGQDDRPGYLFPVGRMSLSELALLEPPAPDGESVAGIMPLTKDKEGLAFWVKTGSGEYVLARIRAIEPASYSDVVSGGTPSLELEWLRPETR